MALARSPVSSVSATLSLSESLHERWVVPSFLWLMLAMWLPLATRGALGLYSQPPSPSELEPQLEEVIDEHYASQVGRISGGDT